MSNTIIELTEFIKQLAHEAGLKLLELYKTQNPSEGKLRTSPKDMKLVEDKTIDQWLIERIKNKYPEHDILTEESGFLTGKNAKNILWIIDPIDGSVNFSTHNPFFAISLAIQINGALSIGVIEAPLLGEQFVAIKGEGAFVNNKHIHVSSINKLADAYIVSCDGGSKDRAKILNTLIKPFYNQVKDFKKLGSAALECAWVAAGRADAYITMQIDPWDVAAGVLLVQEAGGQVTTLKHEPWEVKQLDLLCSNGLLHEQILK
ncbi:MAG: inositol monophosphatase family protein [Patescibacteria group bacterium]|jgi:myo-inositol-1(or 4)-monophosphatase